MIRPFVGVVLGSGKIGLPCPKHKYPLIVCMQRPQPVTPMHFLHFGKELSFSINHFNEIEDGSRVLPFLKEKYTNHYYY